MPTLPALPPHFSRGLLSFNPHCKNEGEIHGLLRQLSLLHKKQHSYEEERQKGWAYDVKAHLAQTVEICRVIAETMVERRWSYVRNRLLSHYPLGAVRSLSRKKLASVFVGSVCVGGWAHDIGKIYTPWDVLIKPDFPDHDEMAILRTHPIAGYRMVNLDPVRMMVRHHHENMNGSGYPDAAFGEEISLGARIIKAADSLHAIVDQRIYDIVGHPIEIAAEELKRCTEGFDYDRAMLRGYFKNVAYPQAFRLLDRLIRSGKIPEEAGLRAEENYRRRYLEKDLGKRHWFDPNVIRELLRALPRLRKVFA